MNKYLVTIEWKLAGHPQRNTIPTWASRDVLALHIARTKLLLFAKAVGERFESVSETVEEVR